MLYTECVLLKFICWKLILKSTWLCHGHGALLNEIRSLIKESNLLPSAVWGHREKKFMETGSELSKMPNMSAPWSWISQPLKLINKCLLFKSPSWCNFVRADRTRFCNIPVIWYSVKDKTIETTKSSVVVRDKRGRINKWISHLFINKWSLGDI